MTKQKKRVLYFLATAVFLALEVVIALYVHDNFIRPYIGDVLVVIVLYTFIRIIIPEKVKLLPLYIFLFAVCVEILQGIHIVELLELQDIPFFRVLIGMTFDWKDVLCYAVGCVILAAYEGRNRIAEKVRRH